MAKTPNRVRAWRAARSGKTSTVIVLVLLLGALVGGGFAWSYYRSVKKPVEANADYNSKMVMHTVGLREPSKNSLAARFADADGDLIADAPKDSAQLMDPPTLTFSYVAVPEAEEYREAWRPFTEHLAKVTGKPVEYMLLTSGADQLRAMRDGKLHVAGFNTGNVPTAVNACGFVPVVKLPTGDGNGMTTMRFIVPADSALQSVTDLRGHEITLTDAGSNSGFKAPLVLLRSDFGMVPQRDFTIRYSGGHAQSIDGVAKKRYQVAAVADDMLARATAQGAVTVGVYRSIYQSAKFPTAGIGYVYNLSPALAAKVREALASFDWKGTPLEQKLGSAGGTKFVPANYKDDWALIRRIDDESGVAPQIAANDPTSAPATQEAAPASTAPASDAPAEDLRDPRRRH